MFILRKKSQHRRDFTAVYKCEHCGTEKSGHGYDDQNFHDNVIPGMKCPECGKTGNAPTSAPDVPAHVHL